jgi:hypothetical protein
MYLLIYTLYLIYIFYILTKKTKIESSDYIVFIIVSIILYILLYTHKHTHKHTNTHINNKETFVDFNVDNVLKKLMPVKNKDELKADLNNYYMKTKSKEFKIMDISITKIIKDISEKSYNTIENTLMNIQNYGERTMIIYRVLLISLKIMYKISKNVKSMGEIRYLIKVLFDYSKNEINILDKKYEKIKKDWDKCYATNGLSRYIGLDSACNKAHKNTIQFRKDVAELPNKIIKKCNSLHIVDKTEKSIDFSEIKKEIDDNREILKKSIVDFDSIKLDTDTNMDISKIENDIMIYKKKLDKFKEDESY